MSAIFWQTYFALDPIHHRAFGTQRKLKQIK